MILFYGLCLYIIYWIALNHVEVKYENGHFVFLSYIRPGVVLSLFQGCILRRLLTSFLVSLLVAIAASHLNYIIFRHVMVILIKVKATDILQARHYLGCWSPS